jgi:hypothetical protein
MQHPDQKNLSYRIALRLFDSAFAACERLPDAEQQLLMREIGARVLRTIEKFPIPTEAPAAVKITGISIKEEER